MLRSPITALAVAAIVAGFSGGAANASVTGYFYMSFGAQYHLTYSASYDCRRQLAGYRTFKVWHNGQIGFGYGGYGGGYGIVKRPFYKKVCHYG